MMGVEGLESRDCILENEGDGKKKKRQRAEHDKVGLRSLFSREIASQGLSEADTVQATFVYFEGQGYIKKCLIPKQCALNVVKFKSFH